MKNKVTIRVDMKMYCSGCGAVLFVSNYLEPVVWQNEKFACDLIGHAKYQLDNAECPKCKTVLTGIDYHQVCEAPPKTKSKVKK